MDQHIRLCLTRILTVQAKTFTEVSVILYVQEKTVEVSDWRKNVEAMSGMEGRKKMFDAAIGQNQ